MSTEDTSHSESVPGDQVPRHASDPDHEADAAALGAVELAPGVRVAEGSAALRLAYSRSSGPGGQNVNKLATKAELRVVVALLPIPERAKDRLARLAGRRLTAEGEVLLTSESERSQLRNRSECLRKLRELLVEALAEPKIRRKTRPTKGSKERRLKAKQTRSDVKKTRRSGSHHDE
jgi:ribosome-associated protein